jgi:prephenate dehydratase
MKFREGNAGIFTLAVMVLLFLSQTFQSFRLINKFTAFKSVSCNGRIISTSMTAAASSKAPKIKPPTLNINHPMKVAYQGEPGAYSEKASKELLGSKIMTVPYKSFEDVFKAVAAREVDYAVVPIENSLGGSIHANFDLLLRYDLHIIGEHEFKVEHFLLALPGTKKEQVKRVLSHPQALAQCDNYLRKFGVIQEPTYDTAGSAKMIRDQGLTDCAAIASDLAAETYGLEVLEQNIEDHDINFTRFLLLSRNSVSALIPPNLPAKTSIVFVVPNVAGALYKALACFSLRDIDFSKIESRPTSIDLLQHLQFRSSQQLQQRSFPIPSSSSSSSSSTTENDKAAPTHNAPNSNDLPRFRYTFYLDFLASEFDDRTQNALLHLKEQSEFVRVLGSYPRNSELIGPVKSTLTSLNTIPVSTSGTTTTTTTTTSASTTTSGVISPSLTGSNGVLSVDQNIQRRLHKSTLAAAGSNSMASSSSSTSSKGMNIIPLKIAIIGFGKFGQFLAKTFAKNHHVYCIDKDDMSNKAMELQCEEFFPLYDLTSSSFGKLNVDVILFAVSIISFEEVMRNIPKEILRNKLIVDVLSVKVSVTILLLSTLYYRLYTYD